MRAGAYVGHDKQPPLCVASAVTAIVCLALLRSVCYATVLQAGSMLRLWRIVPTVLDVVTLLHTNLQECAMSCPADKRPSLARGHRLTPLARWPSVCLGMVALLSMVLLAGCRHSGAGSLAATMSPTSASLPTVTPTATTPPTATTTPKSATASRSCQPDTYGVYASQSGYVATLTDAPLPAPAQTKHGIGSGGANAVVTQAGESGMCTIGTFAAVTAFYTQRLPALGWRYSAPPPALDACFHTGVPTHAWWKGSDTFSWYDDGDAGGGSIFWSYTYCTAQT